MGATVIEVREGWEEKNSARRGSRGGGEVMPATGDAILMGRYAISTVLDAVVEGV